jgi:hypothetical protein
VILVTAVLIFSYREGLLNAVGRLMAPNENGKADLLILEGGDSIDENMLAQAASSVMHGKCAHLMAIVHKNDRRYNGDDRRVISNSYLKRLGLKEDQFSVMETPSRHPITLTEARMVLEEASRRGARRAIIETDGFHERRSYVIYKAVGKYYNISVIPETYFIAYQPDNWWKVGSGVKELFVEVIKLTYYYGMRYIP